MIYTIVALLFAALSVPSSRFIAGQDRAGQLAALTRQAEVAVEADDYNEAIRLAREVLAVADAVGDDAHGLRAHHVIGLAANFLGQEELSEKSYRAAIAAAERVGNRRARALSTLGLLHVRDDSFDEELALYERSLADARESGDRNLEGRLLHSLGDNAFNSAAYAVALEKLEAAARLFQESGDSVALGTVHNSLGRLYRSHGRLDMALEHQLKALAAHEKASGSFNHLQSLNAVAVTYQALGDHRLARRHLDLALTLAQGNASPRIQDFLRGNATYTMVEEGDLAGAATTLEGIIERKLDAYLARRYIHLAYVYLALGRDDDASVAVDQALKLCGQRNGVDCLRALDQRAAVHLAAGRLDRAQEDFTDALATVESLRAQLVPSDFFKQQFSHAERGLYGRAIDLQMRRGNMREALAIAERARSRAFLDLLATRAIAPPAEATGGHSTTPRHAHDLPSRSAIAAASVDDLQQLGARLQSTIVAYWVGSDALFAWVVNAAGEVNGVRVEVTEGRLARLISETARHGSADPASRASADSRALVTRGADAIALQMARPAAWRQLHDLLIQPIRHLLPRGDGPLLTIIPHGPLTGLSFAALHDARGRYLVEDYAVHYVPAAAMLRYTSRPDSDNPRKGHVLLVADPALPPRTKLDQPLPRLPGARAEARAIARLVTRDRVTLLEDAAASEALVAQATAGKAVVHFATHAVTRDDDPFASFLAVGGRGTGEDGLLTAHEVYRLRLDADLVVLSACRAASGRVTGDGIATFARGFLYAGATTVIASVWDVADEPTNRLIPAFYQAWFAGSSKAKALRTAQLALIRELRANRIEVKLPVGLARIPEHPMFWGGFAVIGDPR